MANVGRISYQLSANPRGFTQGLNRAQSDLRRFAGQTKQQSTRIRQSLSFGVVGGFGQGLFGGLGLGGLTGVQAAATVAGAALVRFARDAAQAIDATGKLADQLAISTESLIGLRHAAELSGVGAEQLDQLLRTLQRNLGLASRGIGEQFEALQLLGVSYQEIANLPLDEQLGVIADALNAIPDPARRAMIQSRLLGETGQRLGTLLSQGSEGIERMSDEAERLGLTFSRADAAKIEEMNDAATRLGSALQGQLNRVLIALGPTITESTEALTTLIETVGPALEVILGIIEQSIGVVTDLLGALIEMVSSLPEGITLDPTQGPIHQALFGGGQTQGQALEQIEVPVLNTEPLQAVIDELKGSFRALFQTTDSYNELLQQTQGLQSSLTNEINQLLDLNISEQLENLADESFGQIAELAEQLRQEQAPLLARQQTLQRQLELLQNVPPLVQDPAVQAQHQQQLQETQNQLQEIEAQLQAQNQVYLEQVEQIGNNLQEQEQTLPLLQAQASILRRRRELEERANQLAEDLQSPIEQFNNDLDQIVQLFDRELISPEQFALASQQAIEQLQQALPEVSTEGPSALIRGSVEAVQAINRFRRENISDDQELLRQLIERGIQQRERLIELALQRAQHLQDLGVVQPANLET